MTSSVVQREERLARPVEVRRRCGDVQVGGCRDPEIPAVEPEADSRPFALGDEPLRTRDSAAESEADHDGMRRAKLGRARRVGNVG